jgi:hypothetical protein
MPRLEDLEVERVDGVDRPATRRRWLLLKAEEPDELRENVSRLLDDLQKVLEALEKVDLPEETVKAISRFAETHGLTFKARKKPEDEEEGYGYPAPEKPKKKGEGEVVKAIADLHQVLAQLPEMVARAVSEALAETRVAKSAPPSRQVQAQDSGHELPPFGEGMFAPFILPRHSRSR